MKPKAKAFTLIETILALGVATIIMTSASVFYASIIQTTVRKTHERELEYGMSFSTAEVISELKKATRIDRENSRLQGSNGKLVFETNNPERSPVTIEVSNETLTITKGPGGLPQPLIPNRVKLTSLMFELSQENDTPTLITATITLTDRHAETQQKTETLSINRPIR